MKMVPYKRLTFFIVNVLRFCFAVNPNDQDLPCAAKETVGNSVICVCNATYCDTISIVPPSCGKYVTYTSSESNHRFTKSFGLLNANDINWPVENTCTLKLNPNKLYQEISGFGGAVTDAAAINFFNLKNCRTRQHFIDSYFSKKGIEYSMVRVPIGGTDFSLYPYAYNNNDKDLSNFALAPEDYDYKIPLINAGLAVAATPIRIVASLWSPPTWMKTVNRFDSGYLKKEHYQTLVEYFIKFLECYRKNGIELWGITTTNEPSNILFNSNVNRLQWHTTDLSSWIMNNLGPTFRNSSFSHIKIITGDDQRCTIPYWFNWVIVTNPGASQYIDGVAAHWYLDRATPPSQLTYALRENPDKFLLYTEASEGSTATQQNKVIYGSWQRAENYASSILDVLNYGGIGWIDWNMCLNTSGGPTWLGNRVDSPILVSAENQEFYKQPMFYAMGHFSKFIPRGSRRIELEAKGCPLSMPNAAFLTPDGMIVVVILNKGDDQDIIVKLGREHAAMSVYKKSIVTAEIPFKSLYNRC